MRQIILLFIGMYSAAAFSQIRLPAPSPTQTIIQDIGLGKVELTYSRPSLKGRQVFKEKSELAPLGVVWRTGANSSTKLKFIDPVTIGGNALDTGTYALFTIPGKNEWTVIINRESKKWGTEYSEKDDVFRFQVPVEKLKETRESFTMQFANLKAESADLRLAWGTTGITIPITVSVKEKIRASVDKALAAEKITAGTYRGAANFYYNYDKDYEKALANINKAIEVDGKSMGAWLLRAQIQQAKGDKTAAMADAEKLIELAKAAKSAEYEKQANDVIKKVK